MMVRRTIVCLTLTALLGAVGCSSGGGGQNGGSTADTTEQPDVAPDVAPDSTTDEDGTAGKDAMEGDGSSKDPLTGSVRDLRMAAKDLKAGESLDRPFAVQGAVVTAVQTGDSPGMFIQHPSGGAENSGVWVFLGNAKLDSVSVPSRGTKVDVTGGVKNFHGLVELQAVTSLETKGQGQVPDPATVGIGGITTGGAKAKALQGALVKVENVVVADADVKKDEAKDAQFTVKPQGGSETLIVFDQFHTVKNVTKGKTYTSITGPLTFSWNNTKIAPRDAEDVKPKN